jgi:lactoylglutathione lyase
MSRIDHVALWTRDLERSRAFFGKYFETQAGELYRSARRPAFASYFLTFPSRDTRLEIMSLPGLWTSSSRPAMGFAHIAISLGSEPAVDDLVARMRADGVRILSEPRKTGDGYYEAIVEDPDGNEIELTV